ncbi:protein POLR1D-like [Lycorma delicatula]|uniref:protein POLR1D-like n=1 Tax=Lycorma delicatula TaxID=130591 RepID=UPI003F5196F6
MSAVPEKDDILLQRLAEEELIREARLAAAVVETNGIQAWQKCGIPKTNKRFLNNIVLNTLSSNRTMMKAKGSNRK